MSRLVVFAGFSVILLAAGCQDGADTAGSGQAVMEGGSRPTPVGGAGSLCLPESYSSYNDWVALGEPDCWCAPYQCDGDVDGATETAFKYRIYNNDMAIVVANWKKTIDDVTLDACADIDHKAEGPAEYRVYSNDIAIVTSNWKKKDADLPGDCPRAE